MADTTATAPETTDGAPSAAASDVTATADTTVQAAAEGQKFDINSLPKEAWDEIFKHDRFKQLNTKAKQAEELIREKAVAEENALKEQGKWKELSEKAQTEVERFKSTALVSEIKAWASKFGAVDLNDVAALTDKAGIQIDENGNVVGAEEAVKALVESKPHLFNTNTQAPRVGSGTNPGNANNQGIPKFTHSQIKDPDFWKAHEKDILAAIRAGTVVDDLAK